MLDRPVPGRVREHPENRSGHLRRAGRDVSAPFLVPRPDDAAIEHLEDLGGENADVQARP